MMIECLRHHADAAREARRAALQVRARSVGVRSVLPLMTCFIPSFLLLGVVPTVVSTLSGVLGCSWPPHACSSRLERALSSRAAISTAERRPERYQQISPGPRSISARRHETPGASDRMQHPKPVRTRQGGSMGNHITAAMSDLLVPAVEADAAADGSRAESRRDSAAW